MYCGQSLTLLKMKFLLLTIQLITLGVSFKGAFGQVKCGPNEVAQECYPKCPETCETLNEARCLALVCDIKLSCVCKPGFVSLEKTCVKPSQCPRKCTLF